MWIIGWILGCVIAGLFGIGKNIGFLGTFFLSLLLSPIIGALVAVFQKSKTDILAEEKQQESLYNIEKSIKRHSNVSVTNELKNLIELKNKGLLTDDEFKKAKNKVLNT